MKTIIKLLLVIIVIANISCKKSTSTIAPVSVLATTQNSCEQFGTCFQDTFVYHPANTYNPAFDSMVIGAKVFYRFIGYGTPPAGHSIDDTLIFKLEYVNINLNVFNAASRANRYSCHGGYPTIFALKTNTNKQLQFSPVPW